MADPFLGMIVQFAGNFAPRGRAFCDGQLLQISQHTALFSLIGTTYGGDGRTTFALPDLRGRVAVHPGDGPGLSSYQLGERGGSETRFLTTDELPPHTHDIPTARPGPEPATGGWGATPKRADPPDIRQLGSTGQGDAFDIRQPYLAVNWIIALQGIYPSRP